MKLLKKSIIYILCTMNLISGFSLKTVNANEIYLEPTHMLTNPKISKTIKKTLERLKKSFVQNLEMLNKIIQEKRNIRISSLYCFYDNYIKYIYEAHNDKFSVNPSKKIEFYSRFCSLFALYIAKAENKSEIDEYFIKCFIWDIFNVLERLKNN